jgi:hypothetical protein
MQRQSFRHATCYSAVRALRRISKRTDILNPEEVKTFLANTAWSESGKERLVNDLTRFYAYKTHHEKLHDDIMTRRSSRDNATLELGETFFL